MIHQSGIKLQSNELARLLASELTQKEKVLRVFYNRPQFGYSADEIHVIAFDSSTPITSIRRCLSDLTKAGTLVKDEQDKTLGSYGIKNCRYRLKTFNGQMSIF